MKIYCVRHGHAELNPDQTGERGLTLQGKSDATKVGNYLAFRGFHVSHVMHSGKKRAVQTADLLAAGVASEVEPEESPLLLPDSPIPPLIEQIQTWDDDTMLVGHMPFISLLVSQLVLGEDRPNLIRFTPATVVCVERYEGHHWIINWIIRPDLIPDKFS